MANCCNPITIPVDPCPAITTADLGVLTYLYGLDANNCRKYEAIGDVMCDMLAGLAVGAPFQIGDRVVGPDCRTHVFNADIIHNLFQGCVTPSATVTYTPLIGQFCTDVNPQWVRDLFSASGDAYVSLTYNNLTGSFAATTNIAQIFADGLCPALAGRPAGPASGPGSTITYLDPDTCQRRQLTTPATFNLCASLAALPAGAPVGQGDFFVAVDPSTCERRLVTIPDVCAVLGAQPVGAPYGPGSVFTISDPDNCQRHSVTIPDVCVTVQAFPAGAPVGPGGSVTVIDPTTCTQRAVTIPPLFDLCAGLNALPIGPVITPGQTVFVLDNGCRYVEMQLPDTLCNQLGALATGIPVGAGGVITVVDPDTCQRRVVTLPSAPVPFDLCTTIASLPVGAPVGAGGSITVVDAATCLRRTINIPAAFNLCQQLGFLPSGQLNISGFSGIIANDGLGNCSRATIIAAVPCTQPSALIGTDGAGNVFTFNWAELDVDSAAVYADAPAVSVTPGAGSGAAVLAQAVNVGLNNTHVCRPMNWQANLRSGRTEFFFGAGQAIFTQQRKDVQLTGPNTANGTMYFTNQIAPPALVGLAQYPADVWVSAGQIPVAGVVAFTMQVLAYYDNALGGAPPALQAGTGMAFGRAQATIIGVSA